MGFVVHATLLLACLMPSLQAVSEEELRDYFKSDSQWSQVAANFDELVTKETHILNQCGVSVMELQQLQDILKNTIFPNDKAEAFKNMLPLAHARVEADKLKLIYETLTTNRYIKDYIKMPVSAARRYALELAVKGASPDQLAQLGKAFGNNFFRTYHPAEDQSAWLFRLGVAGTNAEAFSRAWDIMKTPLKPAIKAGVSANLAGLERRYAKNGQLYSAAKFQREYAEKTKFDDAWLSEWNEGVKEQRVAADGKSYSAMEFREYYGGEWEAKWQAAMPATLMRLADDGKTYTLEHFKDYYGDSWQQKWFLAADVPCQECAGPKTPRTGLFGQKGKCGNLYDNTLSSA